MGLNLYKEVTMNLQLTRQNHGFEENNSSVTNAQRPLARGRDCDIFALRLRERPPEPSPSDCSNSLTPVLEGRDPTQPSKSTMSC